MCIKNIDLGKSKRCTTLFLQFSARWLLSQLRISPCSTKVKTTPKRRTYYIPIDSRFQSRGEDNLRKIGNRLKRIFGGFKRYDKRCDGRVTWVSSGRGTVRTPALPFPWTVRFAIWVVTTESWPSLRLRACDRRPRRKGRPTAPWRTSVSLIAVRVTLVQHRIACRSPSHRDTFYYFGTDETWLIEEDEGRAKRYRFSEERRRRRLQLRRGKSPDWLLSIRKWM